MALNVRRAEAYAVATAFIFKSSDVATPPTLNVKPRKLKALNSLVLFERKSGNIAAIHQFQMWPEVNKKEADAAINRAKKQMIEDAVTHSPHRMISIKLPKDFVAGQQRVDIKTGRFRKMQPQRDIAGAI